MDFTVQIKEIPPISSFYDSLEQLIYSENIGIQAIDVHLDQDLLIILLNTGGILRETISKYPRLKAASDQPLKNYRLIGKGVGVDYRF